MAQLGRVGVAARLPVLHHPVWRDTSLAMCLICHTQVAAFDGWCVNCAGRALHNLLSLRDVKERVPVAEILRLCECPFLARVVMEEGVERPTQEDLDRLAQP
jgi:hypothetical protein